MPTGEQIKQFLVGVVIPPIAGAVATWLFATVHVFNMFGITEGQVAGEIDQLATFGIVTAIGALVNHHILSGHYTAAAKAANSSATK